jgi:hypothetical protein
LVTSTTKGHGVADTQVPCELFAAYVEAVDESDPAHRRRRQWVILPPLPARLAPGDAPATDYLVWFERQQRNAKHRAVWQYRRDVSKMFKRNLHDELEALSLRGFTVSEVMTCEIHPTELAQILKEPKTPYRILDRFKKVARSMYRLDIS